VIAWRRAEEQPRPFPPMFAASRLVRRRAVHARYRQADDAAKDPGRADPDTAPLRAALERVAAAQLRGVGGVGGR